MNERNIMTRDAGPPPSATILRAGVGEGAERGGQSPQPGIQPMAPQDRERAIRLVKKGDEQLAEGNIAAARLFYERAANIGLAPGRDGAREDVGHRSNARRDFTGFRIFPNFAATLLLPSRRS